MARTDAYPDGHDYADTGCEESPSCLSCPLPACKFDVPLAVTRRLQRDQMIRSLIKVPCVEVVQAVALRLGISQRTVWRVLARDQVQRERG